MDENPSQRLDSWLDVSCVFKTRSAAARACDGGKVDVNGARGKPHKPVRPGDILGITLAPGRRRVLKVLRLCETSVPKSEARTMYDDLTPPPTAEQVEVRRLEKLLRPEDTGRPGSRDRRALRRLKGR